MGMWAGPGPRPWHSSYLFSTMPRDTIPLGWLSPQGTFARSPHSLARAEVPPLSERESMKRYRMGRGASRRNFTRAASRTHRRNVAGAPMRGGIRL